ncbi:MAG: DUF2336 domain-containing protein [Bradyrhizobiaceae bacterium]|nr:DUF2336 domain-containing protein [Bradyrhizobiaceae bacterium]
MSDRQSLIIELERSIEHGSSQKRANTLRRLTELFTGHAEQLSDEQVELFDDVILRLAREIETKARAELARRLAPIDNAPPSTIRNLANDEEIEVAAPVLMHSRRLQDADLVDIATKMGQAHLLAISSRRPLASSVTDVLVDRGDGDVLYNVAANASASFSEGGLAKLVDRAGGDDSLVSRIAERPGIPPHLFHKLVLQASGLVQQRLLAQASPQMRAEIEQVLAKVSQEIDPSVPAPRRFTAAQRLIGMLHRSGALGESELYDLAKSKRYEETVAALSVLCSVQVEQIHWLMNGDRIEPLLIHLKAAGFDWLTVRAIILLRPTGRRISAKDLEDICDDYSRLSYATARRVIGHWQGGETGLQATG